MTRKDLWIGALVFVLAFGAVWGGGEWAKSADSRRHGSVIVPSSQLPGTATANDGDGREEGDGVADWTVSGAGDASYNGDYSEAGTHNGETYYEIESGGRYLWRGPTSDASFADSWVLSAFEPPDLAETVAYYGTDPLPGSWSVANGTPPAPTVAAVGPDGYYDVDVTPRGIEYTPGGAMDLSALRCYFDASGQQVQAAVYDDSGNLEGTSGTAVISGEGWEYLVFDTPVSLSGGSTYYLIVWGQAGAQLAYDSTDTDGAHITDEAISYNTWPDPGTVDDTPAVHYWIEIAEAGSNVGAYSRGAEASGANTGAYSRDSGDMPIVAGHNRGAYSRGVSGANTGTYDRGIGERNAGAYSRGIGGANTGAYDRGVGGARRGVYSRGPEIPLQGRNRGAYSRGAAASGRNTGAYTRGRSLSGRNRGAYSRGQRHQGSNVAAYSRGSEGSGPADVPWWKRGVL